MRLKNFQPAGNQVLAKVKFYNTSKSGLIHNLKEERDMFATVVAVGPQVERTKVGDVVMFGEVMVTQFPFEDGKEEILCILTNEFNILAYYTPDKDEDRIFVAEDPRGIESELPEGVQMVGPPNKLGEWASENSDLIN